MISKFKENRGQIAYTALTILMLCALIIVIIAYIYNYSEDEGLKQLDLEMEQIKSNIDLQVHSDRENLSNMANFASQLYSEGEDFDLVFSSYSEMGLISGIGILLPDNKFLTKTGPFNMENFISFDEEVKKGEYISGRTADIMDPDNEVVRIAVPILAKGSTVGILYGAIDLNSFEEKYAGDAAVLNAELYILEAGSGNFLVDTKHDQLGNVTALASIPYRQGFSYDQMISDMSVGISGYSAFQSQTTGEYIYVHYGSLAESDWMIMLSKSEDVLFSDANTIRNFLLWMFFIAVLILGAYLAFIYFASRRKAKVDATASSVRKRLLEISRHFSDVQYALEDIRVFARSRSAFFVDSQGEDYNSIIPSQASKLLTGEERAYFIRKLMDYVSQNKKEQDVSVHVVALNADNKFRGEMPEFHQFLTSNGIKSIHFTGVIDDDGNTGLIGAINPRNHFTDRLLKEIAVCFSMAIHSKKHLNKTEAMALTDSLTGLANRMAYKQDMKELSGRKSRSLACIYIDVNELHYFNNKYGHAAGDQMLIFIAEVLKNEFPDSLVYRMGGDEFLIFAEDISSEDIDARLSSANEQIREMKYHISMGIRYMEDDMEIEDLVNAAEKEMYIDKSSYYLERDNANIPAASSYKIESLKTGVKEVDTYLSVMSRRYLGAYYVSLKTDTATCVLAPSYYFALDKETNLFSKTMKSYIHDTVSTDFHRPMMKFLDYESLERQLRSGHDLRVPYTRMDGGKMIMSIYAVSSSEDEEMDTIWIFEEEKQF